MLIVTPPGPLQVERLTDGRRLLLRPLRYTVRRMSIIVPAFFTTDYSSDPTGLLDWSTVDIAGVVHDFLYQHPQRGLSRWTEDVVWFQIARAGARRTPYPLAVLGWLGMRLFGWPHKQGYPRKWKIIMGSVDAVLVIGALLALCSWWHHVAGWILAVLIGLILLRNLCR